MKTEIFETFWKFYHFEKFLKILKSCEIFWKFWNFIKFLHFFEINEMFWNFEFGNFTFFCILTLVGRWASPNIPHARCTHSEVELRKCCLGQSEKCKIPYHLITIFKDPNVAKQLSCNHDKCSVVPVDTVPNNIV